MLSKIMSYKTSYKNISKLPLALFVLIILGGCSSSASVQVDRTFPKVLGEPKPVTASIVFAEDFSTFVAQPNENTVIDIGTAQVQVLQNAFAGLFNDVEFVTSRDQITNTKGLVITPLGGRSTGGGAIGKLPECLRGMDQI